MKNYEEFYLRIDGLTPDTIPMARLAEYLKELAALFGHTEGVHFDRVAAGSLKIFQKSDAEHTSEIRERLFAVLQNRGAPDAKAAWERLNAIFVKDNTCGTLCAANDEPILCFPGRGELPVTRVITVEEEGSLDGKLLRIGGMGKVVPAVLQEGKLTYYCKSNREVASVLAHHLFGSPLRVFGHGKWSRLAGGVWHLQSFLIERFDVLEDTTLMDEVLKLRAIVGFGWKDRPDPFLDLRQIRYGIEGDS